MSTENISSWPEGTREILRHDNKKEIVLPKPTNMREFEEMKFEERRKLKRAYQSSVKRETFVVPEGGHNRGERGYKHFPRRQEEIRKNRKDERSFREDEKRLSL